MSCDITKRLENTIKDIPFEHGGVTIKDKSIGIIAEPLPPMAEIQKYIAGLNNRIDHVPNFSMFSGIKGNTITLKTVSLKEVDEFYRATEKQVKKVPEDFHPRVKNSTLEQPVKDILYNLNSLFSNQPEVTLFMDPDNKLKQNADLRTLFPEDHFMDEGQIKIGEEMVRYLKVKNPFFRDSYTPIIDDINRESKPEVDQMLRDHEVGRSIFYNSYREDSDPDPASMSDTQQKNINTKRAATHLTAWYMHVTRAVLGDDGNLIAKVVNEIGERLVPGNNGLANSFDALRMILTLNTGSTSEAVYEELGHIIEIFGRHDNQFSEELDRLNDPQILNVFKENVYFKKRWDSIYNGYKAKMLSKIAEEAIALGVDVTTEDQKAALNTAMRFANREFVGQIIGWTLMFKENDFNYDSKARNTPGTFHNVVHGNTRLRELFAKLSNWVTRLLVKIFKRITGGNNQERLFHDLGKTINDLLGNLAAKFYYNEFKIPSTQAERDAFLGDRDVMQAIREIGFKNGNIDTVRRANLQLKMESVGEALRTTLRNLQTKKSVLIRAIKNLDSQIFGANIFGEDVDMLATIEDDFDQYRNALIDRINDVLDNTPGNVDAVEQLYKRLDYLYSLKDTIHIDDEILDARNLLKQFNQYHTLELHKDIMRVYMFGDTIISKGIDIAVPGIMTQMSNTIQALAPVLFDNTTLVDTGLLDMDDIRNNPFTLFQQIRVTPAGTEHLSKIHVSLEHVFAVHQQFVYYQEVYEKILNPILNDPVFLEEVSKEEDGPAFIEQLREAARQMRDVLDGYQNKFFPQFAKGIITRYLRRNNRDSQGNIKDYSLETLIDSGEIAIAGYDGLTDPILKLLQSAINVPDNLTGKIYNDILELEKNDTSVTQAIKLKLKNKIDALQDKLMASETKAQRDIRVKTHTKSYAEVMQEVSNGKKTQFWLSPYRLDEHLKALTLYRYGQTGGAGILEDISNLIFSKTNVRMNIPRNGSDEDAFMDALLSDNGILESDLIPTPVKNSIRNMLSKYHVEQYMKFWRTDTEKLNNARASIVNNSNLKGEALKKLINEKLYTVYGYYHQDPDTDEMIFVRIPRMDYLVPSTMAISRPYYLQKFDEATGEYVERKETITTRMPEGEPDKVRHQTIREYEAYEVMSQDFSSHEYKGLMEGYNPQEGINTPFSDYYNAYMQAWEEARSKIDLGNTVYDYYKMPGKLANVFDQFFTAFNPLFPISRDSWAQGWKYFENTFGRAMNIITVGYNQITHASDFATEGMESKRAFEQNVLPLPTYVELKDKGNLSNNSMGILFDFISAVHAWEKKMAMFPGLYSLREAMQQREFFTHDKQDNLMKVENSKVPEEVRDMFDQHMYHRSREKGMIMKLVNKLASLMGFYIAMKFLRRSSIVALASATQMSRSYGAYMQRIENEEGLLNLLKRPMLYYGQGAGMLLSNYLNRKGGMAHFKGRMGTILRLSDILSLDKGTYRSFFITKHRWSPTYLLKRLAEAYNDYGFMQLFSMPLNAKIVTDAVKNYRPILFPIMSEENPGLISGFRVEWMFLHKFINYYMYHNNTTLETKEDYQKLLDEWNLYQDLSFFHLMKDDPNTEFDLSLVNEKWQEWLLKHGADPKYKSIAGILKLAQDGGYDINRSVDYDSLDGLIETAKLDMRFHNMLLSIRDSPIDADLTDIIRRFRGYIGILHDNLHGQYYDWGRQQQVREGRTGTYIMAALNNPLVLATSVYKKVRQVVQKKPILSLPTSTGHDVKKARLDKDKLDSVNNAWLKNMFLMQILGMIATLLIYPMLQYELYKPCPPDDSDCEKKKKEWSFRTFYMYLMIKLFNDDANSTTIYPYMGVTQQGLYFTNVPADLLPFIGDKSSGPYKGMSWPQVATISASGWNQEMLIYNPDYRKAMLQAQTNMARTSAKVMPLNYMVGAAKQGVGYMLGKSDDPRFGFGIPTAKDIEKHYKAKHPELFEQNNNGVQLIEEDK